MGRYVRKMRLMLTSTVQTKIWDPDQTAPRRSGSTVIATKTSFSNELADDIWVPMMAQHCWLSSFVIFQGILTSIAKKPYISYVFFKGEVRSPCPHPSGFAHEYAQLMLDPYHRAK